MHQRFLLVLFLFLMVHSGRGQQAVSFAVGKNDFILNGKPFLIRCGEMHFARIPRPYWRHRLQMAKAMGLNAVCAYLFWNLHEKEEGVFDWQGQADAAAFCRLAQEEGLLVILRPGPYSCAEWDLGGFPWWLLKNKDVQLRTRQEAYLDKCHSYLREVGRVLAPLQVTRGGPIIMVQVENEYGSYGSDTVYLNTLRNYISEAGFDVPLFHCDGPTQLKRDHPKNLFAVVNFGSNPESAFAELRKIQPEGPLMCGEFYPGWFDSWGRAHHKGKAENVIADLKWMLDHNASFSIYMAHGGTTFGPYAGANAPPYSPQTSSYDYDAPIDEAGNATPKFYAIRRLFEAYLQPGEILPAVPPPMPRQKPAPVRFTGFASVTKNLPNPVHSDTLLLMEDLGQDFGALLYETELPAGKGGRLQFRAVHDYALVYLDNKLIGTLDRRKNETEIRLPPRSKTTRLTILVEATGRVNYGAQLHDRKGLAGPAVLVDEGGKKLSGWKHYALPMGNKNLAVKYAAAPEAAAGFYKGRFTATAGADTYLDMRTWNKGMVWVNGVCLGRYWNIGPTQTMFVPGCWLKTGQNEVVVFDLWGTTRPSLSFLDSAVLDQLKEARPQKTVRQKWTLTKADHSGALADSDQWQTVSVTPVRARYFCLEALSEVNGQPYTSLAELHLLDAKGKEIARQHWKVVYADSEELNGEDGKASNVFDLQPTTIWHTQWQDAAPGHPHRIVIDLGLIQTVSAVRLLQRQDGKNGRIRNVRFYFSTKPFPGISQ